MKPETVHSRILYNDDRILVYNKPNRKAVHNGPKVGKTIYQQLEEANVTPVYPVHRLDRDTTGCLLFAKDQEMANYLSNLMKHHRVLRSYLALCIGIPEQTKGEVGGIIGHFNRNGRWQMGMTKRITSNNRDTVSKYRVLKTYLDAMSMMELQPVTGAKHQLKVHCAQLLKTPIFGDNKYAPKALHHSDLAQRLTGQSWGWNPVHLHAHRILIPEYKQTNDLVITAPLPTYFLATLMRIESYTFHRTRTAPQKDRTVDRVDEGFLQKLTGMSARESFYDINATMPEEDQDLQDMSYAEEDMYKRSRKDLTRSFSSSKGKQHLKINNMMRRTVSKNSER
ncbi:pseudouridylate synthase RPUSD4, mitochondrial-like [Bolinopsis microptera]|uniref:pseudouridylate synthase RPUSD4, mitochondrial-like n=1 Tax=Bolinopsis microptera TaxID=2820187 RepID=UPI00307AA30A